MTCLLDALHRDEADSWAESLSQWSPARRNPSDQEKVFIISATASRPSGGSWSSYAGASPTPSWLRARGR